MSSSAENGIVSQPSGQQEGRELGVGEGFVEAGR